MNKQRNLNAALLLCLGSVLAGNAQAAQLDLNGDKTADMLWRDAQTNQYYAYHMQADGQRSVALQPHAFDSDWSVAAQGDFSGDGRGELWMRNHVTGQNYILMRNHGSNDYIEHPINIVPTEWNIVGVADFNADGHDDLLWRNQKTGVFWHYLMNGVEIESSASAGQIALSWRLLSLGDVNGDGKADKIFQHRLTGELYVHEMDGAKKLRQYSLGQRESNWSFAGSGDFDGDGNIDLLWRHLLQGDTVIDFIQEGHIQSSQRINQLNNFEWYVAAVGDFNADSKADLYWYNAKYGLGYVYQMDGANVTGFMAPRIEVDRYQPVQPLVQPVVFNPAFASCLQAAMATEAVTQVAQLTHLSCDSHHLTHLQLGDQFAKLEGFFASDNQLTRLPLKGADSLKLLVLSENNIEQAMFHQYAWPALESVNLRFNPLSYATQTQDVSWLKAGVDWHTFSSERFMACAYQYLHKKYQTDYLLCDMGEQQVGLMDLSKFPSSTLFDLKFKVANFAEVEVARQHLANLIHQLDIQSYNIDFVLNKVTPQY